MLSIPIASYCSIKRLVLENLPSLKFAPLINLIGIIPIPLSYCSLVLVKIAQGCVALTPNSQLLLNRAPTLNYFSCAQQDHKLNGTGIIPS
ncbi:hypothetical protein ESZ39_13820 [Colwellia sp. C1TZA3]|nr:hypothetical protein ESZ39_13820 [Colwellia sp. C1TZA3]